MTSELLIVQTVLGTIGNITGLVALLAPVPTFFQIVRARSTERRLPWPYVCTLLSSSVWAFYGLPIVGNSTSIAIINSAGVVISAAYCAIFFFYVTDKDVKNRLGSSLGGLIVLCSAGTAFCLGAMPFSSRAVLVGLCGDLTSVLAIASPLADVKRMVRTRNVQYFPIALCAMNLLNTVIWTLFGISTADVYITLPNLAGVILSSTQVVIYLLYRKSNLFKFSTTQAPSVDPAPLLESYMSSEGHLQKGKTNSSWRHYSQGTLLTSDGLARGEDEDRELIGSNGTDSTKAWKSAQGVAVTALERSLS